MEPKATNKKRDLIVVIVAAAALLISAGIVVYSVFFYSNATSYIFRSAHYVELPESEFGSAGRLSGNCALVTVFADEASSAWDFDREDDIAERQKIFEYCAAAADWITGQAARYGETVNFLYPKDENDPLLCYEAKLDADILRGTIDKRVAKDGEPMWSFIADNVKNDRIKSELGCENISYLFFCNNAPDDIYVDTYAVHTTNVGLSEPYEFCVIASRFASGATLRPEIIAHETLHTYGAVDLYGGDSWGTFFGVGSELMKYAKYNTPEDIMLTSQDLDGDDTVISQSVDEVTAYFLGWLKDDTLKKKIVDCIREDDGWRSQFDRK